MAELSRLFAAALPIIAEESVYLMLDIHSLEGSLHSFFPFSCPDIEIAQGKFYIFLNVEFVDKIEIRNTNPILPFRNIVRSFFL